MSEPDSCTQLSSAPRTVQVGLDVSDATRRFVAVIDRVNLALDAQGQLAVTVPAGATLTVWAADTARYLQATEAIVNLSPNSILSSRDAQFAIDVERLLAEVAAHPGASGTMRNLAANRVVQGTFSVAAVVSDLRVGRASSTASGGIELTRALSISVPGTTATVAGMGIKGTVRVN